MRVIILDKREGIPFLNGDLIRFILTKLNVTYFMTNKS